MNNSIMNNSIMNNSIMNNSIMNNSIQRIFGILYLDDKRIDIDNKGNHLN